MGERNDGRCEQFDISPDTIEQELGPVVCEQRQTDRYRMIVLQDGKAGSCSKRVGKK